MNRVPETVKRALGELASRDFTPQYVREVEGYKVYYVKPNKPGCYGFPLIIVEKGDSAKLLDTRDGNGLHFWKAIADYID